GRAFTKPWLVRMLCAPRVVLSLGIVLRLVTFIFLDPKNVDGHWLVVAFIAQQGRLPHSGELGQAYHPPLYYCLAAPIYRWSGSFKAVQLLSLMLSILSLLVLYKLVCGSGLIRSSSAQLYCLLLVCFLPQFVLYTLFVSNDTLTIFLGCCLAWCITEFCHSPNYKAIATLMLVGISGLLTKATFLAYLPVLFLLISFIMFKSGWTVMRSLATAVVILTALVATTSYKEIDNYRQYRRPFISNIDFHPDWAVRQELTYRGLSSYLDFNFLHLLSSPSYSPSTESAYPLMLYATFWYQHVPESNFVGSAHRPFTWIAFAIYILALFPSIVFLTGTWSLLKRFSGWLRGFSPANPVNRQDLARYAILGMLAGNLGIMLSALAKYHVWSIMQGRLLFPSIFAILIAFSVGTEEVEHIMAGAAALKSCMFALCILFVGYLLSEIGLQFVFRFMPEFKEYLRTIAV
ncbi:MAG TPA: hypothetical protein VGV15_02720, partial [Terriglobales bacterium]|nr:hypothetical protein [Terriglobales bacterium]